MRTLWKINNGFLYFDISPKHVLRHNIRRNEYMISYNIVY